MSHEVSAWLLIALVSYQASALPCPASPQIWKLLLSKFKRAAIIPLSQNGKPLNSKQDNGLTF